MGEFDIRDLSIGSSAFWILMTLVSLSGLIYLMIQAFHQESIRLSVIAMIFAVIILSGIVLSRLQVFDLGGWRQNCLSFAIGFIFWGVLGTVLNSSGMSLILEKNYLFASVSSQLPLYTEFILNAFIIPIAEEMFWMVGLPFALISIMRTIGKEWEIFQNALVQMAVVITVASITFGVFHVGKLTFAFLLASMIFRTIMILTVYGDYYFNWIKFAPIVASFSIGSHIANNWLTEGWSNSFLILQTNLVVSGFIFLYLGIIFLSAIEYVSKAIYKGVALEE